MGIQPWIGYGGWWIAEEQGIFDEHGLDVRLVDFTSDSEVNSALIAGQLEGASVATHTALRLLELGSPIKIVLVLDQSNEADAILAGPGVDSVADLVGKKVAYEEGATSDILLRYALSQEGLTIDDVERVSTPAADAGAAAIAGRVEAAVTYEPYLTAALQQDEDFELIYTAAEKPGLIGDVLVVREDVATERPDQVAALVEAWGDAIDSYQQNTEDGQHIIETAVGAETGSLATAFEGVELYNLEAAHALMIGEYPQTLEDVMEVALSAGILESAVDAQALLDTSFIERVR